MLLVKGVTGNTRPYSPTLRGRIKGQNAKESYCVSGLPANAIPTLWGSCRENPEDYSELSRVVKTVDTRENLNSRHRRIAGVA